MMNQFQYERNIFYKSIGIDNARTYERSVLQMHGEDRAKGLKTSFIDNVRHMVRFSSPTMALMCFGKTLIYDCHSRPRCSSKWVQIFLPQLILR